jgi:hypothetical protein
MKTILLPFVFLVAILSAYSQTIHITQLSATEVSGGINVNLKTISFNGAGYIGSTYSIADDIISISACYWFNPTLPIPQFNNDIFIPISPQYEIYTIDVNVYNSASQSACDYHSLGDTASTSLLSSSQFNSNDRLTLAPNPTDGMVELRHASNISSLSIHDMQGRLISRLDHFTGSSFDLRGFNAGVYVIRLETADSKIYTEKIVLRN